MRFFPKQKYFGKSQEILEVPNLVELQIKSYEEFLQMHVPSSSRNKAQGLEAIIREIFPIESYNKKIRLEYLGYELGKPRYSPDDCRKLKLTYGTPFKIRVRLEIPEKKRTEEEEVYLGEIPIMIGGGEFIINGAERVIVSQLHRSPGVDFAEDASGGEKHLHTCWIIPDRGSWIDVNVTKKDTLVMQIDKSGKIPITTFIRALDEKYSTDEAILSLFYAQERIPLKGAGTKATSSAATTALKKKLSGRTLASPVIVKRDDSDDEDEDSVKKFPAGTYITDTVADSILKSELKFVLVLKNRLISEKIPESEKADKDKMSEVEKADKIDLLIVNTLNEDNTSDMNRDAEKEPTGYESALRKLFTKFRPGNPFSLEKAKNLIYEKFQDTSRYRLGRVGRFRLNRKFRQNIDADQMVLTPDDLINTVRYVIGLRQGYGELDDIDHLGNRRIRTIIELAGEEFRKGFLKLKRTIQDRMSSDESEEPMTPRNLINAKTISSSIEYFFGRGELSQVVDQTNPLAQLTHERRLSALGPGGLNRKRAGFDVRDVHISHYGRICPIETPEGTNIGLISSLAIYANIDHYGFLVTPYRIVKDGKITKEVCYLRADQELNKIIAPADSAVDANGVFIGDSIIVRKNGDYCYVKSNEIDYCDVSPKQIVGVSASLIPFLEHDDANRALMGSNMQRQAVPLIITEPPIVGTGMEVPVAQNSSMVIRSEVDGVVLKADGERIIIKPDAPHSDPIEYQLRKFVGLNERTCLNQKTIIREGERVTKNQVIADGAATCKGELALGRNVLVAFMPWDGYNFEDAIIVSHKLVKEDYYTSIHIDEFEAEIRETKLGKEDFTKDIPNVPESSKRYLDENGIVKIGTIVKSGDILVGKVAPKSKSELSPEEKLLHAIFGRAGEDVKNDSLEVPSGVEGIVIATQKFSRGSGKTNLEDNETKQKMADSDTEYQKALRDVLFKAHKKMRDILGGDPISSDTGKDIQLPDYEPTLTELRNLKEQLLAIDTTEIKDQDQQNQITIEIKKLNDHLSNIEEQKHSKQMLGPQSGDELPTGVLELVKVYIATKRVLSVGDKMAGRHGNKGVIAKILPEEDMPFLKDGTPVEIILNPLGVPSRMNVGQILETHLGWCAKMLGFQAITPVFDGAQEKEIEESLRVANQSSNVRVKLFDGKKNSDNPKETGAFGTTVLYDGRTGDPFLQKVTVGYIYMMKLHHLVDDKVHARATGPYSLITQQPLGGKARFGGQRFGEMEVWALEAYGVANILQELLTVKSDDVEGRTKIYESMVRGENSLEPGTPVSFEVLTHEIKGLALDMELHKKKTKISPSLLSS